MFESNFDFAQKQAHLLAHLSRLFHSTKSKRFKVRPSYTVLHIFRQVLFGAGDQGSHQNFEKSLLSPINVDQFSRSVKKIEKQTADPVNG